MEILDYAILLLAFAGGSLSLMYLFSKLTANNIPANLQRYSKRSLGKSIALFAATILVILLAAILL